MKSRSGPAHRWAVAPASCHLRLRNAVRGAAMSDLLHFIAPSLLPRWSWAHVVDRLRAGDPPADVFNRCVTAHWPGDPDQRSTLYARAQAAIDRAKARQLTPVVWSDAAYPFAFTTIVDPPPVL